MQGINDLVTPFLAVFLSGHFQGPVEHWGDAELPEEARGRAPRQCRRSTAACTYFCNCVMKLAGLSDAAICLERHFQLAHGTAGTRAEEAVLRPGNDAWLARMRTECM